MWATEKNHKAIIVSIIEQSEIFHWISPFIEIEDKARKNQF